ncbi:MAG: HNH endonuclease [Leptolyngbya sp. UWPOB_LEPTO1]|uniref:HNH endonuclease n=1 Tax=Leptolyngbya sp. UWPOB_LEPTO1 TaxID=2815653 RepID=UPI001AD1B495|nr:HNH endonuclease [Leptolyngbya sp. UWPOB_LEPTO1]MBN8564895.1 HNH endonuclease [Leptolyngbya sp. UWPOB_LEPTO1]
MQATEPHILQASIVVFSKNYLPIARINIKRAIVLIISGQAEALDFEDAQQWEVRSPNVVLHVSEHIRLTGSNPERHWKVPAVSRREVLRRDSHTCQYCGSTKHLTIDHVIPRSRGGSHSWDNVVTACAGCNSKKGDRFLSELGMKLKTKPKAPIHPAIAFAEQFWKASEKKL